MVIGKLFVIFALVGGSLVASAQVAEPQVRAADSAQAAQQPVRPWTHPDVIVEALKIRMGEDQRVEFRAAITAFLQGYGSDERRIFNSNNQANLPRKIATKRRNRVKQMDETMAGVLSEEQFVQYESYRNALLAKMDEEAAARRR